MAVEHYTLYRIYYGDQIVYIGRTKQPLQNRIRGHLYQKPMHRTIDIEQVSKIEYTELPTEADMNLYEIYYILTLKPLLNVDDKTKDYPTVTLPELVWSEFRTKLWEKWKVELVEKQNDFDRKIRRRKEILEKMRVLRSMRRVGDLTENEYDYASDKLQKEYEELERGLK